MNFVDKLKKFMKFICDKYEADDAFRAYGEFALPLIEESGIDFGDGQAQLAAMDILLHQGLIEVVNPERARHIRLHYKIRPSLKALEGIPGEQRSVWQATVSAVLEGITRGIKG